MVQKFRKLKSHALVCYNLQFFHVRSLTQPRAKTQKIYTLAGDVWGYKKVKPL